MTLIPGTTVGRYQILEPLGQGGMATVYKAFQPSLQREVALKVLRPGYAQDQEFRERFEREAIAIAKLRHPHIVQVFDFEIAQSGEYVLAMEFLEGGTLKERLVKLASEGRGNDPAESVRIIGEVASALSYAHEKGIVHRDVKPSNVMLTERDRAVVTDFGIARILGSTSHTQTGVGIGTPEYMAPEQGQGQGIDHRADIYSLGAMAYELLTGRVPYSADTPLAVVLAHIKDPLPLPSKVNPTIGKGTERALLKALAKDPAQRFDSATGFADALRAGLADDTKGGTVPTVVVRGAGEAGTPTPRRAPAAPKQVTLSLPPILARRPMVLGIAGGLVLAVVAGAVLASNVIRDNGSAVTTRDPIPKGAMYWEAKLDGTQGFIRPGSIRTNFGQSATNKDPNGVVLRTPAGAAEIANAQANTQLEFVFDSPVRQNYVAEIDVQFPDGGKIINQWTFRRASVGGSSASYWLQLEPDSGRAFFQYNGGGSASGTQRISDPVTVFGLKERQKVTVTLVVEDTRFTYFADGRQMGQVVDTRVPAGAQTLAFSSYSTLADAVGVVRVTRARFFELDRAAVSTAVAPGATPGGSPPVASPPPAGLTFAAMRGPQIFAATLGSLSDVTVVGPSGFVGVSTGTLIMSTPEAGRAVEVVLGPQLPTEFAAEMDVSFDAGASLRSAICVRSEGERKYCLTILGGSSAEMRYLQQGGDIGGAFGPSVPAQMTGRTSKVGIVVERSTFTVFLDDRAILQSSDPRIATSTLPLSFQVQRLASALDRTGSARISNIRLYGRAGSSSSAAPTQPAASTPKFTLPARGGLLWEAKLDGVTRNITNVYGGSDASAIQVREVAGAIEITKLRTGDQSGGASFAQPVPTTYVSEIDLAATPGTELQLNWTFRNTLDEHYAVYIRMPEGQARFEHSQRGTLTRLGADFALAGIASGTAVTLALVVEATRFTLYIDGRQVAQISDTRIPKEGSQPGFWALPKAEDTPPRASTSTIRITGARYYQLP